LTLARASTGVSSSGEVFDAVIQVVDQENKPVKGAAVWLVSGDLKTFQGKTDESGQVQSRSIRVGKNIAAFYEGRKTVLLISDKKDRYNLLMPLTIPSSESNIGNNALVQGETDVSGIVVSMKPDNSSSSALIMVSGDPLSAAPDIILSQPPSYTDSVSMTASGANEYSGTASLEGRTGNLDITASSGSITNEALCPFYIYDTTRDISPGFTSHSGDLVISKTSSSFSGEGMLAILTIMTSVPENGYLVHIGNAWSLGFSDSVGEVNNIGLSIFLSPDQIQGLDLTQLNLYGWDLATHSWKIISGGNNDGKSFGIRLDSIDYTSYALFAPVSSDITPPQGVSDLQASTGQSRQRIELEWTAPGDNSSVTSANSVSATESVFAYYFRYNTVPITESNWDDSTPIPASPPPAVPGTTQIITVEMPDPNADYYFAMRSIDSAGNKSTITSLSSPTTSQATDTDGDGMPDLWETSNSLNPNVDDSQNDDEGDGLKNIEEYQNDTDPKDADTDNDGYLDGDEVNRGSDPNDPESTPGSSIALSSMWNLISLYRQPADSSVSTVLDGIAGQYASVWAYINGSWKVYDPQNPGFSDLSTIESGYGYWIFMITNGYLGISGSPPAISINLNTDWNLVGYNSSSAQPIADALASIAGKYISVWAFVNGAWKVYDPANPGFSDLTIMEPGYGYWINATEDCAWILPID